GEVGPSGHTPGNGYAGRELGILIAQQTFGLGDRMNRLGCVVRTFWRGMCTAAWWFSARVSADSNSRRCCLKLPVIVSTSR
ncbi:MAG: hypothetical protein K0U78_00340, partial [Actinomycetia bacterium]|nr:hypothetical protein [Actinomycetes bacterium]